MSHYLKAGFKFILHYFVGLLSYGTFTFTFILVAGFTLTPIISNLDESTIQFIFKTFLSLDESGFLPLLIKLFLIASVIIRFFFKAKFEEWIINHKKDTLLIISILFLVSFLISITKFQNSEIIDLVEIYFVGFIFTILTTLSGFVSTIFALFLHRLIDTPFHSSKK